MQDAPRDEVLLARLNRNAIPADDECVTALHDGHVLVEVVSMGLGRRRLATAPERHLAPFRPIVYVALHTWRGLTGSRDSVCGAFHELWELGHIADYFLTKSRYFNSTLTALGATSKRSMRWPRAKGLPTMASGYMGMRKF